MKLPKTFYQRPALDCAKDFLGKYLVFMSLKGKVSGKIIDVEAYPAFVDEVSHANKKTKRTSVIWQEGGYAYVYLIYGLYYQFAVVVNHINVPEVVFIRAVIPDEGIDIMKENSGRTVKNIRELTESPGKLCKSFGINLDLYGADLTADKIWLEDRNVTVLSTNIKTSKRIGINTKHRGSESSFRYFIE